MSEGGARTCPACGSADTRQYDTRHVEGKTLRLRQCNATRCAHKWHTVEEVARQVWVRASTLIEGR